MSTKHSCCFSVLALAVLLFFVAGASAQDQAQLERDFYKLWGRFASALQAYYTGPSEAKLDELFSAGEDALRIQPDQQYIIAQLALAGSHGAFLQIYKNLNKVKRYSEQALKAFEPTKAPKDWLQSEWDSLREVVHAQMNQFMGFYLIETKGDQEQAISYLTKSIQTRMGKRDPNNYWLRASIYSKQYQILRAQYDALADQQKMGETGNAILARVNPLIDKMIEEYACVIVTATKPEAAALRDAANGQFGPFWQYRHGSSEKARDYLASMGKSLNTGYVGNAGDGQGAQPDVLSFLLLKGVQKWGEILKESFTNPSSSSSSPSSSTQANPIYEYEVTFYCAVGKIVGDITKNMTMTVIAENKDQARDLVEKRAEPICREFKGDGLIRTNVSMHPKIYAIKELRKVGVTDK